MPPVQIVRQSGPAVIGIEHEMNRLCLRSGLAADRAFCESLQRANMDGYLAERSIAWDPLRFEANWLAFDNRIIVADQSDGGLLRMLEVDGALEIRDLQLLASHTGRGIGAWAVQQAKALAAERGLRELRLRVYANNPAQRLYTRQGFVPVAVDDDVIHMWCAVSSAG